ncbi:hypothetical protein P4V41_02930 [Fictibacillus nanhaiensis]|uniref:hypothetical protein n=1 Tax=Fictibacillus nanhaiensis TaxID=742169 RepID=UPI002E1F19BF|nr:hypothetical protein [Fictibacillus nanhaiensis]
MISFIILLLFTLIVSPVLYFYPPNIPLKLKMTLLGIAFLLALGGLFVFDILSYWLSVAAIVAIAFIASYLAEKRLDLIDTNGEKTEIILSFSDDVELADPKREDILTSDMNSAQDVESAVTLEELPVEKEIPELHREAEALNEQAIEDFNLEKVEELEVLQELKIEVIEPEEVEPEVLLEANEIEEIQEVIAPIGDLTEEEFAFLSEGREIILEEGIDSSNPTDINDEEMIIQRSALLDELEELEETTAVVENSSEIHCVEEEEELEAFEDSKAEEVEQEIAEIQLEEATLIPDTHPIDETKVTNDESLVLHEEMLKEIDMDELEVISKEELDTVMVVSEQTEVLDDTNKISAEEEEALDEEDHAKPLVVEAEHHEEVILESNELLTNEEALEDEVVIEEVISVEQKDMDVDVQDMLLNTLTFYQVQADTESYEDMLQSILTQALSNKDFYLFSKFLLESYMARNNIEKSQSMLDKMRERLDSYPVIMEEIDRYAGSLNVKK